MDFEKIISQVVKTAMASPTSLGTISLVKEPSVSPIDTILVGNPSDQISGVGQSCLFDTDSCMKSEAIRDPKRHDTSLYSAFS